MQQATSPHLSTDWWREFARLTNDGHRPYLFKGLVEPLLSPSEIDATVRGIQSAKRRSAHARMYVAGQRRDDLVKTIFGELCPENVRLVDWVLGRLETDKVAFLINDFQDWSEVAVQRAAPFFRSMFCARGQPSGGIELILFAGNYAATPFGAHRGYEHAFLFHCGPGVKQFHLWEPKEFERLTGKAADVLQYAHLLPYATTWQLDPGDVLYLPALWFHVGTQDSYSCSIAAGLYQPAPADLLRALLDTRREPWPPLAYLLSSAEHNPLEAAMDDVRGFVQNELPLALEQLWYKRLSNAGFVCGNETLEPAACLDIWSSVRVRFPFRLCWVEDPHRSCTRIYLRHRVVSLPHHPTLPELLMQLAGDNSLRMADACDALADRWSPRSLSEK